MAQFTDSAPQIIVVEQSFIRRVYNWMTAGLGLTALISFYMLSNPELIRGIVSSPFKFYGAIIVEIGVVIWLSRKIHTMSTTQATFMFFLYAGLNGITLTPLLAMYTAASLAKVFFITAATFGATSFYGYVTKKDLTSIGGYAMMGLIGVIIASIINLFIFKSSGMDLVISYVVVALVIGLTAYDTQKIKQLSQGQFGDHEIESKAAIMGALSLYLDFILMFIHLVRILGDRR